MYPWLLMVLAGESEFTSVGKAFFWTVLLEQNLKLIADRITVESRLHGSRRLYVGNSYESVQCAMLKACDACADMGQL